MITARPQGTQAGDAVALALDRIAQDKRVKLELVHGVPPEQHPETIQHYWEQSLSGLRRGDFQGLAWLRDDVVVDDFLLFDRLDELGPQAGICCQRNEQGETVFMFTNSAAAGHQLPVRDVGAIALSQAPGSGSGARPLHVSSAAQLRPLLVVSATRQSPELFYTGTALGQSITRLRLTGVHLKARIFCNNKRSLGEVYNSAIEPAWAEHIVVFVHDDVQIDDWQIAHRLHDALKIYDLVGVAGNRQRAPGQPAWHFPQHLGHWAPAEHLLGCVGHDTTQRKGPGRKVRVVSHYGASRGSAQVLDGVLLAARGDVLLKSGLRFDPRFGFHFYDLDISRHAVERGLALGVWPMAITHMSIGGYNNDGWRQAYQRYLAKWGEAAPIPLAGH
jgi:hypothetical protein